MSEFQKDSGVLDVFSIPAVNSLDFLKEVFRCYDQRILFTISKNERELIDYPGMLVTAKAEIRERHGWGRFPHVPDHSNRPAQIVFTSGTEGRSKAVVLSAANLADAVKRLNQVMELDDSVREYVGVPVTYSFGLGRVRAVSAAGGAFYLPVRFDPREIRDMLENNSINAISAVPSLWRIVLSNPEVIGEAGRKVRWIEIGSQYMSREEKEAMKHLFPEARIVQHYGLTEASRSTFLDISMTTGEQLESVGAAMGETALRIGDAGEICICGPHVALGVLDQSGMLVPVTDSEGWLHTGDRGELSDGMLWFLGRLDDQINVAGVKLGAETLEDDIRKMLGGQVSFAITGVPDQLRGEAVLLAVTPETGDMTGLLVSAAELSLKRRGISQSGVLHLLQVPSLPATETGKIQRRKLRKAYTECKTPAGLIGDDPAGDAVVMTATESAIAGVWQRVVGDTSIRSDHTFYDIGGDSLSVVQLDLTMENQFSRDTVRATLEGRPLREIAAVEDGLAAREEEDAILAHLPENTVKTWAINATRGVMVLSVLVSHWAPGLFARFGLEAQAESTMGLIYRMGTPGFGTIFGIGLGFFMLSDFSQRKKSVAKRLHVSFLLVLSGLILTGLVEIVRDLFSSGGIDALHIARAFYNVLAFYVFALATAYLWLSFLSRRRDPVPWALAIAVLLWPLWWLAKEFLPEEPLESILEWPRLLLVANYSVLHVSTVVFAGVALGYWLAHKTVAESVRALILMGASGCMVILVAAFEVYGVNAIASRGAPFFSSALGFTFYFFFTALALGVAIQMVLAFGSLGAIRGAFMQGLIVIGGLSLPIYAFHRIVIPIKDILLQLGLNSHLSLMLPLGTFLAFLLYGGRRLYRMYFA